MSIPRFLRSAFPGFEVVEMKEWILEGRIEVWLEAMTGRPWQCHRCGRELESELGLGTAQVDLFDLIDVWSSSPTNTSIEAA